MKKWVALGVAILLFTFLITMSANPSGILMQLSPGEFYSPAGPGIAAAQIQPPGLSPGGLEWMPVSVLIILAIGVLAYFLTPTGVRHRLIAQYRPSWEALPAPVRRFWWILPLALFLLPVLGQMMAMATFLVVIWGGVLIARRVFDNTATVTKDATDLLTTSHAEASQFQADTEGVLAGQLPGSSDVQRTSTEDRAVVIGPPGTGKTVFLVSQLLDWARTGRPFLVLDIKPEIYGIVREQLEGEYGYRLMTYNPTAGTGERYNPLDDADDLEAIGELAAALVPRGDEGAVFSENARDLLDAIINHLQEKQGGVSLADVREYLSQFDNHKDLVSSLKKSDSIDAKDSAAALGMMGAADRLMGSIFAHLRSNLRFLRYPKIRQSLSVSDFSLADLCQERVGLFLQFEEKHRETTAHLFSAFIAHTLRYFIAHTDRPPLLLLLDEIGNVPAVPGLIQKLNTIRSRHLPTWMYWQSKEQMQPYGMKADEGPNTILGACDFQMVFRLNDNATAQWMSDKIGTVDRRVSAVSKTKNPDSWFLSTTHTESLQTEPIIKPHELQQLPDGEVIVSYRGVAWRGHAPAYYQRYPQYKDQRPDNDALRGSPYPSAPTLKSVAAE